MIDLLSPDFLVDVLPDALSEALRYIRLARALVRGVLKARAAFRQWRRLASTSHEAGRARREEPPAMSDPRWHPVMSAVEGPPGFWRLVDALGRGYGTAELRRVKGGEVRYRVEFRGELIGWATTLRLACERIHAAYLREHGPSMSSGAPDATELARRAGRRG